MNRRGSDDADDPGDDWWDETDDGTMRGWIPPDDRLWRHPSEGGKAAGNPALSAGTPGAGRADGLPGSRHGAGPWIAGGATACVLLALAAAGLTMVASGSSGQPGGGGPARTSALSAEPTTEPGAGRMPKAGTIADVVATARQYVVALQVGTSNGTVTGTGIVTESGGIIVTSAHLVSGARAVTVVEQNGTGQPASIVGVDRTADLAVLRIADDLPAASFDVTGPTTDSIAVAMSMRAGSRQGTPPSEKVYAGTVASTGRAVDSDKPASSFSDPVVEAPLADDDIGCPLLDTTGQVSGMLEWTTLSNGATDAVFLPAVVVLGVTQQLVSSGEVDHGWLGVGTSDADPPPTDGARTSATTASTANVAVATTIPTTYGNGARVDTVESGSPAAQAGLLVGDVIVGVDRSPTHSKAELDTRLYPDAPGVVVDLSIVRDGSAMTVPVVLADAGSDAPGGAPSP